MKKISLVLFLVLTLIFASCTMENNGDEDDLDVNIDNSRLIERSEAIADRIVEEYGIDDATTIIFNEYALVAVKIAYNENITQEQIDNLSKKVIEFDEEIVEVLITDESSMFREIDDIVFDLLQGGEYKDYLDEIIEIKNSLSRTLS